MHLKFLKRNVWFLLVCKSKIRKYHQWVFWFWKVTIIRFREWVLVSKNDEQL